MTKRKPTRKRTRKRRSTQSQFGGALKMTQQATQGVIGLGALGIVSTAAVKIAKP